MRITIWIALLLSVSQAFPRPKTKEHAKNVIVLLQDEGGIATLNGASIYGYNAPLKLFFQSWPQIGLSNTSPASQWVSDPRTAGEALTAALATHARAVEVAARKTAAGSGWTYAGLDPTPAPGGPVSIGAA
jgi:alkaline phosphatase